MSKKVTPEDTKKEAQSEAKVNLCVLCERLLFFYVVNVSFPKFNVEMEIKKMCIHDTLNNTTCPPTQDKQKSPTSCFFKRSSSLPVTNKHEEKCNFSLQKNLLYAKRSNRYKNKLNRSGNTNT